jgi:hypothetical protein
MQQEIISLNPRPWIRLVANIIVVLALWYLAFWLRDQTVVWIEGFVRESKNHRNIWEYFFLGVYSLPALFATPLSIKRWSKQLKNLTPRQSLIIDFQAKILTHRVGQLCYTIPYEKINSVEPGKHKSLEIIFSSVVTRGEQKIIMPFVKNIDFISTEINREIKTAHRHEDAVSIKQAPPAKKQPLSGQKVKGIPVEHLGYVPA